MKSVRIHTPLSSGLMWSAHVMERAKAPFQIKTNLLDVLSDDIQYIHHNVIQTSKNRNKT